jgi:S1-C subfamily serine protease
LATKTSLILLCISVSWCCSPLGAQEDREAIRKVYDAVHKSFVGIDVTLKKKTRLEKAELEEESLDAEAQRLFQLSENEQPFETWGVAIEKDLILMADKTLKESDIEKIQVTDAAGAKFEAKLHAIGRNHDFVLLKPSAPHELVPLAFSDWERPNLGESFHVTHAELVDHAWQINVSPYIQTNAPLLEAPEAPGTKAWFCMDMMRPGSVVSDKKGATVGIALDAYLWVLPDGRSSFLGKSILADDRLADLDKRYEPIRKALPSVVKRVEVTFRSEKQQDRYMPAEDAHAGKAAMFGVALDDKGTLFVPQDLSREMVRKIEDITVVEDGKSHPAAFVGLFHGFGGMIVRAEGLQTRAGIVRDGAAPPRGQLFLTATFEDRFNRSRIKLDYNRLFRTERGLAGAARIQPRKRIKTGSFLLDFDGRVIGCATLDKKEEDFDEVAAESSRDRYFYAGRYRAGYTPDHLRRLIFFSEIEAMLANPAAHFDARAVPMSKKDEKKLVWLGVEFQELSKPLAEALGVQERDLTNDGRRGLMITEIYPGSPAAKAGLKLDDILLSVQPDGESARDLVAEADRFGFGRGMYPDRRVAAPPWKPTKNYLTSILTEIGATKKVTFDILRGKEKSKVPLALEYAPTDYETAERYKDDALGLTVKELTYEVRHFQKMEPGVTGVTVAKVESGSKSDVAKLAPLSIIVRVNDVSVKDLAHFRELAASTKGLTLTTVLFGQTKLVELPRE